MYVMQRCYSYHYSSSNSSHNDCFIRTNSTCNCVQDHKLSYDDGWRKGTTDAYKDEAGLNGHGYDESCPSGHTDVYCQGYVDGYKENWNLATKGSGNSNTESGAIGGNNLGISGNNNHVTINQVQSQK